MVFVLKCVRFASELEQQETMVVAAELLVEAAVYSAAVQEHLYILFLALEDIAF